MIPLNNKTKQKPSRNNMLVVKENVSQVSSALHTTSKHTGKTYHTQNFLAGRQKCSCSSVTQDGRRWPPRRIAAPSPLTTGATTSAGSRRGSCRCLCGCRGTKPTRACCDSCVERRLQSSQPFHVGHIPSLPSAWVEGKKERRAVLKALMKQNTSRI